MINLISPSCSTSGYLIADTYLAPNGSIDSIPQMTQVNGETVSAALEIQSTLGALLIPRMTSTQRLALTASNGMMVYDTTLSTFYVYEAGSWQTMGSSSSGGVFGNFKVGVSPFPNTITLEDPTQELSIVGGSGGMEIIVSPGASIFLDGIVSYSEGNTGFVDNVNVLGSTIVEYTALKTDSVIEPNTSVLSPTIQLPADPDTGQTYKIIDTAGNAATNNIFISSPNMKINGANTNMATVSGTTFTVGSDPEFIAITPNGYATCVGNSSAGTVSIIQNASSTTTPTVVATVSVGTAALGNALQLACTPDSNRLFVTNAVDGSVAVITGVCTGSPSLLTTVTGMTAATSVCVTPNGLYAYVACNNASGNTTYQLNNASIGTPAILNSITGTGASSTLCVVTPNGNNVYVINSTSSVKVIGNASTTSPSLLSTSLLTNGNNNWLAISPNGNYAAVAVNASGNPIYFINNASSNTPVPLGSVLTGISAPDYCVFSPNGNYVYVSGNTSGGGFTVSIIQNASSNAPSLLTSLATGDNPHDIVFTPNGNYAYLPNQSTNTITVVQNASTNTPTVLGMLTVGSGPYFMAITPNGQYAYVADYNASIVSYITNASYTYTIDGITTNYAGKNVIYNGTQWNVY